MAEKPLHLASRRDVLCGMSLTAATMALTTIPVAATPDTMRAAIAAAFGGRAITEGRVVLTIPALAENGNSVPLSVSVPDSPMSAEDHVRRILVFSQENPLPDVARFHLGPRSGRASVSTRIRLADSQTIIAVAEMSDGGLWSAAAETVVTLAACIDLT